MSRMASTASKSLLTAGLLAGLGAGATNFPARAAEATGAVPKFAPDRSTAWIPDRLPVTISCRRSAGRGR
jgi:hypothetical protein